MMKNIAKNDYLILELIKDPLYFFYKNGKIKKFFKKHGENKSKIQKIYMSINSAGYSVITYKNKKLSVHRIIYAYFKKDLKPNLVINHINSKKRDNRITNLEMITLQENSIHTYKKGKNKSSKLNEKIIKKINKLIKKNTPRNKILKKFKISYSILRRIEKGETWRKKIITNDSSQNKNRAQLLEKIIFDKEYVINNDGTIYSVKKNRKLKGKDSGKYKSISYKGTSLLIHRIIARKFLGTIPTGWVVNHIDGNQHNNNLRNLQIVSQKENMIHSAKILKKVPKKITHQLQNLIIQELIKNQNNRNKVSKKLEVTYKAVNRIFHSHVKNKIT